MLGLAIRATIAWRKFGESVLKLDTIPAVIGGYLRGVIETSVKIRPEEDFSVRLLCHRGVVKRTSKGSSIQLSLVWEKEQRVRDKFTHDMFRTLIPVSFYIPYECEETSLD